MKTKPIKYPYYCLAIIMCIGGLSANAQKLPNVQPAGLYAPANVKIDGKATEWGGFQAYNPATELSYTITNDDKNLYLVVQTNIPVVVGSIMRGGLQLIIQPSGQKTDKDAAYISFPWYEKHGSPLIVLRDKKEKPTDSKQTSDRFADSLMKDNNKKLLSSKWISTSNIQGAENRLPIFNDQGIQAAHAVDIQRNYTCELAIDLSKLKLNLNSGKFAYHIMVNGSPEKPPLITIGDELDPVTKAVIPNSKLLDELRQTATMLSATTDFWGEYTLIKK